MKKTNDSDELKKEFNEASKNLHNVLNSLTKKIQSFEQLVESSVNQQYLSKYKNEMITGEISPPYTLLEDYGSLQKIFLSRNYYLLIDLNENQSRNISRIEVSNKIIE